MTERRVDTYLAMTICWHPSRCIQAKETLYAAPVPLVLPMNDVRKEGSGNYGDDYSGVIELWLMIDLVLTSHSPVDCSAV